MRCKKLKLFLFTITISFFVYGCDNNKEIESLIRINDSLSNVNKENENKFNIVKDSLINEISNKNNEIQLLNEEKSKININNTYEYYRCERFLTIDGKIERRAISPHTGQIRFYGNWFEIEVTDIVGRGDIDFKGDLINELETTKNQIFKYEVKLTKNYNDSPNQNATIEYTKHTDGRRFIIITIGDISHLYGIK